MINKANEIRSRMTATGCTRLEADAWCDLEHGYRCSFTLERVRTRIAQSVAYRRYIYADGYSEPEAWKTAFDDKCFKSYERLTEAEKVGTVYENYLNIPAEYERYAQRA
jgi:hypothetical protein